MKINVLSILHGDVYGGPQNRNLELYKYFKDKDEVCYTILMSNDEGSAHKRYKDQGIVYEKMKLVRLRATKNPFVHIKYIVCFFVDVRKILKVIHDNKIDVVQVNGLTNLQGIVAAKLAKIQTIIQVLDTRPPVLVRRMFVKLIKKYVDVVMCTGKRVAEMHPGLNVFPGEIVYFYPPVDIGKFKKNIKVKQEVRKKLGYTDEDIVIGTVGNINPQKGLIEFTKTACKLHYENKNCKFLLVGRTYEHFKWYLLEILDIAKKGGMRHESEFRVVQTDISVSDIAQAFDIYWLTSTKNSEGIPTSVEEAMALGIPVVSYDVGSIAEIMAQGENGFIVENGDIDSMVSKTNLLIRDKEIYDLMSRNCELFARKNFSKENCANQHLIAYRSAIRQKI